MAPTLPNPGDALRAAGERLGFMLSIDRRLAELLAILQDTHRILAKLEKSVDGLQEMADRAREGDVDVALKRLDRMEAAVLNIERGTLKIESALHALPKGVQRAIAREFGKPR